MESETGTREKSFLAPEALGGSQISTPGPGKWDHKNVYIYPPTPFYGVTQVCDLTAPSCLVSSWTPQNRCFGGLPLRLSVTHWGLKPMSESYTRNKSALDAQHVAPRSNFGVSAYAKNMIFHWRVVQNHSFRNLLYKISLDCFFILF